MVFIVSLWTGRYAQYTSFYCVNTEISFRSGVMDLLYKLNLQDLRHFLACSTLNNCQQKMCEGGNNAAKARILPLFIVMFLNFLWPEKLALACFPITNLNLVFTSHRWCRRSEWPCLVPIQTASLWIDAGFQENSAKSNGILYSGWPQTVFMVNKDLCA